MLQESSSEPLEDSHATDDEMLRNRRLRAQASDASVIFCSATRMCSECRRTAEPAVAACQESTTSALATANEDPAPTTCGAVARVCKRPAAEHAGPSAKPMIKVVRRKKEGQAEAYIMKEGKYACGLQLNSAPSTWST